MNKFTGYHPYKKDVRERGRQLDDRKDGGVSHDKHKHM